MNAFRNLTLYRLPASYLRTINPADFDNSLAACPLADPGPNELASSGFRPMEALGGGYTFEHDGCIAFCFGQAKRVMPTAAIHAGVNERLAELRAQEGREAEPRERRRIRDEVFLSMLARAFIVPTRVHGVLDLATGFVWLDTAAPRAAELVISALRQALGSFPALPASTDASLRTIFTAWLTATESPRDHTLTIGTSAVLAEPVEGGARIAAREQEMFCEEIEEHLRAGKLCTRLALALAERVTFTLDETLAVRGMVFNDEVFAQAEDAEDHAAHARAGAILVLDEIRRLVRALEMEFEIGENLA